MNERIRSLLDRAEYQVGKQYGPDWEVYVEPSREQILEKFAELIVWECVRYFNEDYVRDFDVLWRENLSKGMKQHFGVEYERQHRSRRRHQCW